MESRVKRREEVLALALASLMWLCVLPLQAAADERLNALRAVLVGSWCWVSTTYPRTNAVDTPEGVGHSREWRFLKEGVVEIYRGGELEKESFELGYYPRDSLRPEEKKGLMLVIGKRLYHFSITKEELVIDGRCRDAPMRRFEKKGDCKTLQRP